MITKLANYRSFTDSNLLSHLQEGDRSAFDEIYGRYWKKLYNESYKRLRKLEIVDEVVQDVFSDLWTKRATKRIESLYPYLLTSTRYQVFMIYRKGKAGPAFEEPLEHIALATLQADSLLNEKDLKGCIAIWMALQPEKRNVIFKMKYMEDYSTKQISEILGISQKTVQNQLLTSFSSLREFLTKLMILLLFI